MAVYEDPLKKRPITNVPGVFQPPPSPSKFVMPAAVAAPAFNTPLSERGTVLQRIAPSIAERINPQARPVAIPKGPLGGRGGPAVVNAAPAPTPPAPPVSRPPVAPTMREPNAGGNAFTALGRPTPGFIQSANLASRASEARMGGTVTALEKGPLLGRGGPAVVRANPAVAEPSVDRALPGKLGGMAPPRVPDLSGLGAAAPALAGTLKRAALPLASFVDPASFARRAPQAPAVSNQIEAGRSTSGPPTRPIRTPQGNLPFAFRAAEGPDVVEPPAAAPLSFAPPSSGFAPQPAGPIVAPSFDQGDGVIVERGGGYGGGPIRRSLSVNGQETPIGAPNSFQYFQNAGLNAKSAVDAALQAGATAVDAEQARAALISAQANRVRADVDAKLADRPAVVEMLLKQPDGTYTYGYAVSDPNDPRKREVYDTTAPAPFNAKEQRGIGNVRREKTSVTGEREVISDPVVLDLATGELIGGVGKAAGTTKKESPDIPDIEETDEYQEAYQLALSDGADENEAAGIAAEFARRRRAAQLELAAGEE